jgi:hypothetical protein
MAMSQGNGLPFAPANQPIPCAAQGRIDAQDDGGAPGWVDPNWSDSGFGVSQAILQLIELARGDAHRRGLLPPERGKRKENSAMINGR